MCLNLIQSWPTALYFILFCIEHLHGKHLILLHLIYLFFCCCFLMTSYVANKLVDSKDNLRKIVDHIQSKYCVTVSFRVDVHLKMLLLSNVFTGLIKHHFDTLSEED